VGEAWVKSKLHVSHACERQKTCDKAATLVAFYPGQSGLQGPKVRLRIGCWSPSVQNALWRVLWRQVRGGQRRNVVLRRECRREDLQRLGGDTSGP